MKNKSYIAGVLAGLLSLSSCSDFLDQKNTFQANEDTYYKTDDEVRSATAPLYNYVWNNFNSKFYYSIGDGRSNNICAQWSDYIKVYTNFTETSVSEGLEEAWGSLHLVVSQSNNVINNVAAASGPSEEAKIQAIAEARFMRGVAYWYIGSIWGRAVLYTDTKAQHSHQVAPANRQTDVFEFAIRDLEFAAANLSTGQTNPGRVTCYSAFGLLSRVYLSMAGLTTDGIYDGENIATDVNRGTRNPYYLNLAREAALKCIEGPYRLLDNYGELFAIETIDNNAESIFQLQWLKGASDAIGFGCNNQMTSFFNWSTTVGDNNWGGGTYAAYDLVKTYDPQDRIRRYHSIATIGAFYPEMDKKNGGYTYPDSDPALDKPKERCPIKKHVFGTHADNGQTYLHSSGANSYMMRLAEVYLNLAEATLGNNASTSDKTALEYFNMVRTRAGMPTLSSIDYDAIHYERRIELAFEGQYWYDLVRRAYYKQQEVINYLNNQNRNASYEWDESEPCQYAFVKEGSGVDVATAGRLLLPFSDVDQTRNPLLTGQTVVYNFGEREVTHDTLYK